ncbi:MAG TPA: PQQ-binding-like beta-propeller repeat protein [Actinomycetota bacterium]|nr:PQQ-binding-like beta-propeller repeat protein [Actinomycetota bacterium]
MIARAHRRRNDHLSRTHPSHAQLRRKRLRALSAIAALALSAIAALALSGLGLSSGIALAQAPGGWSQFQGDAGHSGAAEAGPAPPYRQAWAFEAAQAEGGLSAPVIAGELVLAVGREAVFAVDARTGEEVWRVARVPGPPAPPAVAEVGGAPAVLFTEGGGDAGAAVRAVALADRRDLWEARLEASSRTGVTVEGDRAYVGDVRGGVYAIALASGAVGWRVETEGSATSPLAVSDGAVYAVTRGRSAPAVSVVALEASSGERLWSASPAPGAAVASGPAVGDGRVVVGFADRVVRALDAGSGSELWEERANGIFSPAVAAAFADDDVLVADIAGQVYRLDGATGAREWDHALNDLVVRSSPVVVGGAVLLGLNDGRLVALDAAQGDLVWESDPAPGLVGALAVAPGLVVAVKGGDGGRLAAYEHDPEGTLVRVPSPTTLDPGRQLLLALASVALVAAAVVVPGRLAARRMGPASAALSPEEAAPASEEGAP